MTGSNFFTFTGSKNPQQSSSEAIMRAKLARLDRVNATLQHELRDANDANGVARAQVAATARVQDAEREMKRAQMAERIARKALDDLLDTQKMAQNMMASKEVKTELTPEPVGKEARRPQVESETVCQGLLATTSENTGDTKTKHGACDCTEVHIRDAYTKLDCKLSEALTENYSLKAANDNLEALSQRVYSQLRGLDNDKAAAEQHIKELEDELQRIQQRLREYEHKLIVGEEEYDGLYRAMEERIAAGVAEAKDTIARLQTELRGTKAQLDQATTEIMGLHHEIQGYGGELDKLRTENTKFQQDLEHQKQLEKHMSENNERILADLTDEQRQRKSLEIKHEFLEKGLADTRHALQDAEQSEAEIRREYEVQLNEFNSAHHDVTEQLNALQEQVESQTSQTDEHKDRIAARNQRIEQLEHEKRALKNELVDAQAKQSSPRPVVNLRSLSTTSNTSLADELDLTEGESVDGLSDDAEPVWDLVELEASEVYHISIAPQEIAKPQLTVSISNAIATTPYQRQDSPLECSPINSNPSVDLFTPKLGMYQSIVTDFAPSQPTESALSFSKETVKCVPPTSLAPTSLAMSDISGVACKSVQASLQRLSPHIEETLNYHPVQPELPLTSAPQRLTMHVFEQSVIQSDPDSTAVCVTDLHSDRSMSEAPSTHSPLEEAVTRCAKKPYALPCPQRRSPIELFAKSAKLLNAQDLERNTASWPVKDDPTNVLTTSHLTTTIDMPPTWAAVTLFAINTEERKGPVISAPILALFLVLLLSPHLVSLLPVRMFSFGLLFLLQHLVSRQTKRLNPILHYSVHAMMMTLAFLCWRFWKQLHAWEQVNGVGFGEGYGNTYDEFGPYGNGHALLSRLPLNWISADSQLSAKAVEAITSTVSAFEGLVGFGPTPSS